MTDTAKIAAGVIGWPVSHSLSPSLHGFWLKYYHIDAEYVALPVQTGDLASVMNKLEADGWKGFNLTMPHKEAVLPLLDVIDESAKHIGAVNTVIFKDGKRIGKNTDSEGFWENIRPQIKHAGKAVILGAGGAARACVDALKANGFGEIIITNRTRQRAELLAADHAAVTVCDWQERGVAIKNCDLLVNSTSLGMKDKEPLHMDLSMLPETAVVNDIVYSPLITPLLSDARARGNVVVDGLGMLLHQAVPAFEAWFGVRPLVTEALRAHVLAAAGGSQQIEAGDNS